MRKNESLESTAPGGRRYAAAAKPGFWARPVGRTLLAFGAFVLLLSVGSVAWTLLAGGGEPADAPTPQIREAPPQPTPAQAMARCLELKDTDPVEALRHCKAVEAADPGYEGLGVVMPGLKDAALRELERRKADRDRQAAVDRQRAEVDRRQAADLHLLAFRWHSDRIDFRTFDGARLEWYDARRGR